MTDWVESGTTRKMKLVAGGNVVVVAPSDTSDIVPLFCPCCEHPMRTSDDGLAFRKVGVCHKCDERWTNSPGNEWPDGPDKNSNEWAEYLEIRALLERPTLTFK